MAIGKSLRFEIFARDGFTCQYCGTRPPDVVLEVDHIHPVSKGGTDEIINLITSCFDCNRGKRAKVLSYIAPRPDADIEYLRVQQESAEVTRFLKTKKKRDDAIKEARKVFSAMWSEMLSTELPEVSQWNAWLNKYGCEELEIAINKTAVKASFSDLSRGSEWRKMTECSKYVNGILKKRLQDREDFI